MARHLLEGAIALALAAPAVHAQGPGSLPAYEPAQTVSGVVRNFGIKLKGLMKTWEDGFRRYHPDVRFDDTLEDAAGMAGLFTRVADIGVSGREPVLTEYFSFYETFHHMPTEIAVASGTYDVKGGSYGLIVYVNKDNPISKLTLKQLDGIFGAERTGGYQGFKWMPQAARSAKEDIRTWGQVGLAGDWANKPIQTYGYALTGMTVFFQQKVFGGGEKWNPNFREYVETNTKQVGDESLTIHRMLTELSQDKHGIAFTGAWQVEGFPRVKPIALAAQAGGPYVEPSKQSFQDRTYPLTRSVYLFINRPPGQPADPKVKEFLRYVLSREGQEAVARGGVYLPLPVAVVREQLQKLE
jgi:phosphate transport system substrate-binding protein